MPRLLLAAFAVLTVPALVAASPAAQTCSTSWTNAAGGAWTVAANWSSGVPTATSDACIVLAGTYSVTVAGFSVNRLTLGGAAGSGARTLVNTGDMSFGTAGTVAPSDQLEWRDGYVKRGTLTNAGLVVITGSGGSRGVNPGANLTAVFRNTGTVRHLDVQPFYVFGGDATTTARAENAGLWDLQNNGALLAGFSGTATFVNEAGATFRKSAGPGTTNINGALTFDNAGTVDAQTGTLQFDAPSTHTTATLNASAGATLNLFGALTFTGAISGSPAGTVRVRADLTASAATWAFTGSGLAWQNGYVKSGTLVNTGLVRLDGGGGSRGVNPGANLTAVFRNTGTVRHLDVQQFYVYGGNATTTARAENAGLWDLQADGALLAGFSGTATFINEAAGTFRKSAGTGTSNVNGAITFDNAGTVDAQTGTLQFDAPSTHTTATLNASAGATLNLFGPLTFTGAVSGTAAGTVRVRADLTASAATWAFTGSGLAWQNGYVKSGTLVNTGLVRLDGAGGSRGVNPTAGATAVFRNTGTVRHLDVQQFYVYGGDATTTARAENAGLWDLQADGALLAGFSGTGLFVNEAAGTFRKSAGTGTTRINGALTFDNAGAVEVLTGTLSADVAFAHQDGARIAGTGTFAKTAPASFLHAGDTVPGSATSLGILRWTGTYTPTAAAALVVDLGAAAPGLADGSAGIPNSRVDVSGAATLAGALNLRVGATATLTVGTAFVVLGATSVTGTFASVVEARGYDFTVAYTSTTVVATLTRINRAPAIAAFDGPATGVRGTALTFTASATDADSQPLTYSYAFGDGTPAQAGVGLTSTSHTFAAAGTYTVTLTVDDLDGGTATGTRTVVVTVPVAGEDDAAPAVFSVSAHPNPARRTATLTVEMPAAGEVRVEAFDALGRRVALLHDGVLAAGTHEHRFDAAGLPAGVYVVRATTGAVVVSRRLTVVR